VRRGDALDREKESGILGEVSDKAILRLNISRFCKISGSRPGVSLPTPLKSCTGETPAARKWDRTAHPRIFRGIGAVCCAPGLVPMRLKWVHSGEIISSRSTVRE
jgi:hypothetical protein